MQSDESYTAKQSNEKKLENEKTEKEELEEALQSISENKVLWLWTMFIFASSPGILNGINITSYVFLVNTTSHYCQIPQLEIVNWTSEQIKYISIPRNETFMNQGCRYYDRNYSALATTVFEEAVTTIDVFNETNILTCDYHKFEDDSSIISEWNLVCDRFYLRSHIQSAFACGKFLGAFLFGIIADKIGRKYTFTLASILYMISAPITTIWTSYWSFLIVRFILGLAGVGAYVTAYTLLSELIMGRPKTWVCTLYNVSYPIGMIILSFIAYHYPDWKSLQLLTSLPALLLIVNCWVLPESPLWLLTQGKRYQAWAIINKVDSKICSNEKLFTNRQNRVEETNKNIWCENISNVFSKFRLMFSSGYVGRRSLLCFYIWFTSSIIYYGLVLNGENLTVNRYVYIALNGVFEIISYAAPVPMLALFGRKLSSLLLFITASISLLSILLIPESFLAARVVVSLLSRFCSSAVFVIFALHTSELFPTTIRNTVIGTSLSISHIGTILAPYIVEILGRKMKWYVPSTVFGVLAAFAVLAVTPLPETSGEPLYNTVEEMDAARKKKQNFP